MNIPAQKSSPSRTFRSAGFTLFEVLIALLVLSVGLLGMAGLQATSLRFNNDSYMQTQATTIANDMADRLRANASAAALAAYPGTAPAQNTSCYAAGGCTSTQMVANDLFEWNQAVATLPAGQGAVVALGGGLFSVTVRWDERRNGATGTGCDPDVVTDLRCLTIVTQP